MLTFIYILFEDGGAGKGTLYNSLQRKILSRDCFTAAKAREMSK